MPARFWRLLLGLGVLLIFSSPAFSKSPVAKPVPKPALPGALAPDCGLPGKTDPNGICRIGSDEKRMVEGATSEKAPYEKPAPDRLGGARGTSCKLTTDCPLGLFCTPQGYCAPAGSVQTEGPNIQVSPFKE